MSRRDSSRPDPADTRHTTGQDHNKGSMTASEGTPIPVDMSADRQARSSIAVLLAGPLIWSVHFMLVYLVVDAGCSGEGAGLRLFDPPVPTRFTLIATAVAALACLASAGWGYRRWRSLQQGVEEPVDGMSAPGRRDRGRAMAFVGSVLSLFGVMVVLFVGLPALVLPAC